MSKETYPAIRPEVLPAQPVVYEIRVKGRLEGERWAAWFEGVTMTIDESGETVLRAPLADQSALYGLLSRLRDLAVPLISVSVVDGEGKRGRRPRGDTWLARINWLLVALYLLVAGGLSALTVFFTSAARLNTALALTVLFGALGGIAYACAGWESRADAASKRGRGWLVIAAMLWPGAILTLVLYLTEMRWLHPALAIALLLFLVAGGLFYGLGWRRGGQARVVRPAVQWDKLGSRLEETGNEQPSPSERDVPSAR